MRRPIHADTDTTPVFVYDAVRGCEDGCPSCCESPKCGNNNEPLDKGAAVMILRELLRGR